MAVKLKDIAEKTGYSVNTVSLVMNGKSVQRESAAVKNVFLPDGKNPYQVIKYSLNSEGEINKVDSENSNSAYEKYSDNTDQNYSLLKYMSKRSIKYKTMGFFTPYAMISAGTAFFVVPKEIGTALEKSSYSDDYFDVGSLTYLPGDRVQTVDIFDIDKSGYAKAVVVYKDAKEKEIGDLSGYALIDSIETVKDIDGTESNGEIQIIPSENAKYVIFDTVKKTICPGTIHDIKDIVGFGSPDASKLFIVRRYSSAFICVIYR